MYMCVCVCACVCVRVCVYICIQCIFKLEHFCTSNISNRFKSFSQALPCSLIGDMQTVAD